MVLPAPSADDASGQGAWIGAIRRELSLTSKGLIVLVDRARSAPLRDLVLALLPDHPDLDVHTDVTDVYRVPEGSVMVLAPQAENADWLNMNRPVFARRGLKVILWCDQKTTEALARGAVDFFDWISHRHECPDAPPLHGVFGIQTALCARAPVIVWTGGDLEACFGAALPGREMVRLSAEWPFLEVADEVRAAGPAWIVWGDVNLPFHWLIVEQALIEVGRRSRVLIDGRAGRPHPVWPHVHGLCMSLQAARMSLAKADKPGRLAALAGLEPEAIELIELLLRTGEDERSIERAMRDAEDPGAAIALRVGRERAVDSTPKYPSEVRPPILRAFREETWVEEVWQRGRSDLLLRRPVGLMSAALALRTHVDIESGLEAETRARRDVEISKLALGPASGEHADALQNLAAIMRQRGRFSEAEALLRQAIEIREHGHSLGGSPEMLSDLAQVLMHQGRYLEAEEVADRALEVAKSTRPPGNLMRRKATDLLRQIRSLRARSSGGSAPPE